jgi:2'-5' RNA ligase
MRIFLAVDIDAEIRGRLAELERELRPRLRTARWVREDGLHLTLRFFGEVSEEAFEALALVLSSALAGIPCFRLDVRGCGVFPDRRRPRILWVGVEKPPPALLELQSRAEAAARARGFAPEVRRIEPHLTIARFRGPENDLDSVLSQVQERSFGVTSVAEAVLYESRLSPKGATYRRLRRFSLEPLG